MEKLKIAISASVIVVFFGVCISIICKDWMWFSRFGAFIVVIAIWLTFESIHDWSVNAIVPQRAGKDVWWTSPEVATDYDKQAAHLEKIEESREQSAKAIKNNPEFLKKVLSTERILLIIGTIIWAFGDLINYL